MKEPLPQDTALLVHIEHVKPIEVNDFVSSLNALNGLYSSFMRKRGAKSTDAKLYVEKIQQGSIDIHLCELASVGLIPFLENVNSILDFAGHMKNIIDYFAKGKGDKPSLDINEYKNLSKLMDVVVADRETVVSIGAIAKENAQVFQNCTFNFLEGHGVKNQSEFFVDNSKELQSDNIYKRVLMQIFQIRNAETKKGNKAIIDEIVEGKPVPLLFASDELRDVILFSDTNPTRKLFQVDVKVQRSSVGISAYTVMELHDVVDMEG